MRLFCLPSLPIGAKAGLGQKIELGIIVAPDRDADPCNTEVDLAPLKVCAIDDFGNRHAITVRADETLFLEPPTRPQVSARLGLKCNGGPLNHALIRKGG